MNCIDQNTQRNKKIKVEKTTYNNKNNNNTIRKGQMAKVCIVVYRRFYKMNHYTKM